MSFSELIEKLGKTIFEAPFDATMAPSDAPELAEIRLAVLEQILKKGQRAAGKIVFPYNVIRICIRGVSDDELAFLRSDFLKSYFEHEIRRSLARSSYRFPADLEVEFRATGELPGAGEEWLRVETASLAARGPAPVPARRTARLTVVRGAATAQEVLLSKERTNIGRTAEVYRAQGPSRRNDLAFTEETEINATVSREHAHIVFFKDTGEYRLYNDRWSGGKHGGGGCGLWIFRDGLSRPVHRDARGVRLKPGDEIQLGRAIVRFQVK